MSTPSGIPGDETAKRGSAGVGDVHQELADLHPVLARRGLPAQFRVLDHVQQAFGAAIGRRYHSLDQQGPTHLETSRWFGFRSAVVLQIIPWVGKSGSDMLDAA